VCVCERERERGCLLFVTPRETNIIDLWVSPFESRGLENHACCCLRVVGNPDALGGQLLGVCVIRVICVRLG
jgi:hypothetical protein